MRIEKNIKTIGINLREQPATWVLGQNSKLEKAFNKISKNPEDLAALILVIKDCQGLNPEDPHVLGAIIAIHAVFAFTKKIKKIIFVMKNKTAYAGFQKIFPDDTPSLALVPSKAKALEMTSPG